MVMAKTVKKIVHGQLVDVRVLPPYDFRDEYRRNAGKWSADCLIHKDWLKRVRDWSFAGGAVKMTSKNYGRSYMAKFNRKKK